MKLLIVDDEAFVRALMRHILCEAGNEVLEAGSGPAALDALRGEAVSVLITDVMMPGMNGYELAMKAWKLYPGLPVLFVSGYAEGAAMIGEAGSKRYGFLDKPFLPSGLLASLAQLTGARWSRSAAVRNRSRQVEFRMQAAPAYPVLARMQARHRRAVRARVEVLDRFQEAWETSRELWRRSRRIESGTR